MAHFVYKKNLQHEKIRDKYVTDRKTLDQARVADTPFFDLDVASSSARSHKSRANSIQSATSSKSSSGDPPPFVPPISECSSASPPRPSKPKLGTILDRNNPMRLFKPDAQTEEQRGVKKRERKLKLQTQQLEAESKQSDTPYMDVFGSGADFHRQLFEAIPRARSSTSSSSVGPSRKRSLFSKSPRLSPQIAPRPFASNEPPTSPRMVPGTSPLLEPLSRYPSSGDYGLGPPASPWLAANRGLSRTRSASLSSNYSRPRTRNASNATAFTLQSSSTWSTEEQPVNAPTWADRVLFGVTTQTAEPARSPPFLPSHAPAASRRHSFSSQEGRPSFTLSRYSDNALSRSNPPSVHSRDRWPADDGGLPYGLSNGYDECSYTPPSMLLLDMFSSLIEEFESTPRIFGYAKNEDYQPSNASFVGSSTHLPHPGDLVILDDELEESKAVLKKRAWFLMAVKWLYFGRILFSPGHHLLRLNGSEGDARPRTSSEELRVLDIDGPAIGDWAWHAAREYPDAIIHVITSGGSSINSPVSPLTCEHASPPNQRRVQIPAGYTTLSPLATGSIDVISSRFLPSLIVSKDGWLPLILECHRVLKHDGYLELSILDPVLNEMGPLLRSWILDNILSDPSHPRSFDIMPSKTVLAALREAGFCDISKVWMWMPATSGGDELSSVTSSIGRYLYDELYCPRPADVADLEARGDKPRKHYTSDVWLDDDIMRECRTYNTAFRWLKVYVRKSAVGAGS